MYGISSSGKDRIKELVEKLFDKIALKLLGRIPSLRNKNIFFNANLPTLGNIFIQSLGNRRPNPVEEDALRGLLDSSHGYIEALKHATRSNVIEQVDGLIKQARLNGDKVSSEQIEEVLKEQLDKAKNGLKLVAESEGTKIRNVGSAVDIARVASERNIEDPDVFFLVLRDKHTCEWCLRNHFYTSSVPKVFKLSQINHGFLSTAEKRAGEVSVCGQHPSCRCSLQMMAPGYGFKNGKLEYVSPAYSEYDSQNS